MMEVYRHQVGGHSRLIKPRDSSKVFKPFSETEYQFYEKVANLGPTSTDSGPLHILRQFVPRYFGITEIQLQGCGASSALTPTPSNTRESSTSPSIPGPSSSNHTLTPKTNISKNMLSSSATQQYSTFDIFDRITERTRNLKSPFSSFEKTTSRSAMTQERQKAFSNEQNELADTPLSVHRSYNRNRANSLCITGSRVLKYIVLQDLVYLYKKPCVLDLKMGRRQRKIGASAEKEERQVEKSLSSTSHSMGFRLCGFQSYDRRTDALCYRDKYWGRKLTKGDLLRSISQWFWDGSSFYCELIHALINKLRVLYACISELRHYRFWSSSLLWVYDAGLPDSKSRIQSLDIKVIDFANTIVLKDNPSADEEYLFGLGNLISILERILTLSKVASDTSSSSNLRQNIMITIATNDDTNKAPNILSSESLAYLDEDTAPSIPPTCDLPIWAGTDKVDEAVDTLQLRALSGFACHCPLEIPESESCNNKNHNY